MYSGICTSVGVAVSMSPQPHMKCIKWQHGGEKSMKAKRESESNKGGKEPWRVREKECETIRKERESMCSGKEAKERLQE